MTSVDLNIVLVGTLYSANVGATSRAMSNMGAKRLILISPACEMDYSAQLAAATGQEAWQNRIEYKDWSEFYAGEPYGLRIALSARDWRMRPTVDLKSTLLKAKIDVEPNALRKLYLIFGPEDCGLSLKDLEQAHYVCKLPTYGENTSLNLAQAAMLAMYISQDALADAELLTNAKREHETEQIKNSEKQPTSSNLFPDETLRAWLVALGFDLSKPKVNAFTVLRRMMLNNVPTEQEIKVFEAAVQQTIRRLK